MTLSDNYFLVRNSLEIRQRHLQACEKFAKTDAQTLSTPEPVADVAKLVSELESLAKTTVRLHARYGEEPATNESKIAGSFLWPSDEEWPICTNHNIPYAPVLQLRKSDFPDFPFRKDSDLMQLLWCPQDHDDQELNTYWVRPKIVWRREIEVSKPLEAMPNMDEGHSDYVAFPFRLYPERVVEYPSIEDLPEEIVSKLETVAIDEINVSNPGELSSFDVLYESQLSTCPGTKLLGWPSWIQFPEPPTCDCGKQMSHLLTISSSECDAVSYPRWLPVEEQQYWDGLQNEALEGTERAPGLILGDVGSILFFYCQCCEHWPIKWVEQCS